MFCRRYIPQDHTGSHFTQLDHDSQDNFVAHSSRDTALTSFAQLGAIRLGARRALISLFDYTYQHVLAEATPTLSLAGGHARNDRDRLRLGCCVFPKERGLCKLVSSLPSAQFADDRAVVDGSAVVVPDVREDWFQQHPQLLDLLADVRFYAAVPIISPRGFTIGAYSVWDDEPRTGGVDEDSLQFLKDMAATVMEHLAMEHSWHKSQQAERMIVGLGSFVEGRSTLRHSWRQANVQYAASEKSGGMSEGQLNIHQQDLQEAAKGPDQKTLVYRDSARREENASRRSSGSSFHGLDRPSDNDKPARSFFSGDESPQEDALSSGIKRVFSRAANLIRESIGAEGVVFLDANSGRFGSLVDNTSRKVTGPGSRESTESSDEITDPGSSPTRHQPSLTEEDGGSNNPGVANACLGFSTSRTSSINDDVIADDEIAVEEAFLTSLLRRYPRGKIFTYNANRSVLDDSDGTPNTASGSGNPDTNGDADGSEEQDRPVSKKRRKPTFQQDASHLIKIFPDARNILLLPIWDTPRSQPFAQTLVWTNNPERVFTNENELVYISAFSNSIMTEIRRLDVEMAEKAKTNLVSSITHELRNPLHGILGTADILSDTAMNALQHGMVHTIESCGRTLLDTINNLLDLNFIHKYRNRPYTSGGQRRTEQHQLLTTEKESHSHVKLDQVLEEVTECVFAGYSFYNHPQAPPPALTDSSSRVTKQISEKTGLKQNNVTIVLDIDPDAEWDFHTHAGAWRRILMNVFGNALKYTPSGFIYLGLKSSPSQRKKRRSALEPTGLQAEEFEVSLTVKDTGKGIGPEYLQKHLFTPFRQEDSLASGSGLGLSIVRQAVGSLGGSIEINSTRGGGTELTIRTVLTHHPESSSDASSSSDAIFHSLRNHTEGKSMGLLGFGSSLRSKRDITLYSSLGRLCRDWFGLSVTSVSNLPSGEQHSFDFYLAVQTELDSEDRGGRDLFGWSRRPSGEGEDRGSPIVVICQSPEEAHSMFVASKNRGETHIFEFISQPCGPRKLARALNLCIQRRQDQEAGRRGSDEEPTRWVEMPKSSYLPLHFGPGDPPDQRMEISKRPTTDTMGNSGELRCQQPPVDGTDPAVVGQQSPATKQDTENPTTGKSVLLVDDNDLNLQLLVAYTKKGGYDYRTGMNGIEAVETYKAQPGLFGAVVIGSFLFHFPYLALILTSQISLCPSWMGSKPPDKSVASKTSTGLK